jgi:peptidoglycan hydrolase-like protein with peptidoglycan-binding domain
MGEYVDLKIGAHGQAIWLLKIKLQLIGFNLTNPQSSLETFDASTENAVREFQKQQNLPITGFVDSQTSKHLEQSVGRSNKFAVLGTVTDKEGKPLPNVIVTASDRDVGKNNGLNKTTTDAQGRYTIFYNREQFSRAEKVNADLLLAVTSHPIYQPDIIFNAKPVELFNLVPLGFEYKGPSEYERLLSELNSLLINVTVPNAPQAGSLEKLMLVVRQSTNRTADPKQNDLVFMREEMAASLVQFDAIIAAIRLSEALKNTFGVAFVYGLIRQSLPSEPSALLSTTKSEVVPALNSAFSNNVIPFYLKKQDSKFLAFLQKLSISHQTRKATTKEKSTLGDLLRLTGIAIKAQTQYAQAVYEYDGTSESFSESLIADYALTNKQVEKITTVIGLGNLASGHAPMVKSMQDLVASSNQANDRFLVTLEIKEWEKLIQGRDGTGYPIDTKGDSASEKHSSYAKSIKEAIEQKYPTATLAHRLPRLISSDDILNKDITTFFEKNAEFDFDQHSVSDYLAKEANTEGIQNILSVKNTLQQTQRLLKVVGTEQRFETIAPLIKAGYNSASQIASKSQQAFIDSVSGSMPEPIALEVHSLSSTILINSEAITARVRDWVNPAVPGVIPPIIDPAIFGGSSDNGLAEIFGSLNGCACEHCQSAYSPAAYYVDLLQELKRTDGDSGALTELFKRRPDLENIQLSCSNTNMLIPYIDLVNEVLESDIDGDDYDNQTSSEKTPAELLAHWEHQNTNAYITINNADLNWAPIFEPDYVQANALFDYFKVDEEDILNVFSEVDTDGYVEACFTLGVSRTTADLFTSSTTNNHGLSSKLTEFMQQSGLNYDAVEQLLTLTWLNPEETIEIEFSPKNGCDIDTATLIGIDNSNADKIWRFLRLNAALAWQISDLGSVLSVASDWAQRSEPAESDLDRATFIQLAALFKISKRTGYDVLDVAAWFSLVISTDAIQVQTSQRQNGIVNSTLQSIDQITVLAGLMGLSFELSPESDQIQPFSPTRAIELLDVIDVITELDVDIYQLRWVLTNEDSAPALFEPKTDELEGFFNNLRIGGKKLREQLELLEEDDDSAELNFLADEFLKSQLAIYLSVSEDVVTSVFEKLFLESDFSLSDWRLFLTESSDVVPPALYAGLRKFTKLAFMQTMFGLSQESIKSQLFLNSGLVQADTDVNDFSDWLGFAREVIVNKQFSQWEKPLLNLVEEITLENIESKTSWPLEVVEVFSAASSLNIRLYEPQSYLKLTALFGFMKRLGATPLDLIDFIAAIKDQNYEVISDYLDRSGKKKIGESKWFEVVTPINNVIREQKRDVLVNYLKAEVPPGGESKFTNTNEIYAYFLIDPEMSSCRQTSRIKNAISTVQLYIQRVRMGLETIDFSKLGPAFDQEWDWRKNYRVWEANRKVFLYPENYIFPELRDDQTVFFEGFVSKLLQDELTEKNIEYAVTQYLEQLDEVARLDIRAIYQDEESEGNSELHILARTYGENPKYYYRKKNKNLLWEGWTPVDIDIKGDHHVLVKHNGRLQLIWMTVEERGDGEQVVAEDELIAADGSVPNKKYYFLLHSSEYELSGWNAAKNIYEEEVPTLLIPGLPPFYESAVISRSLLRTKIIDFKLYVAVYLNNDMVSEIMSFIYDVCSKKLEIDEFNVGGFNEVLVAPQENSGGDRPTKLKFQDMKLKSLNRTRGFIYPVSDYDGASTDGSVERYSKVIQTSKTYSLLPSSQKIQFRSGLPFIFEDSTGVYLVRRIRKYKRSGSPEIVYWPARFEFRPFYHPFSCSLLSRLYQQGLPFLYGDFHREINRSPGYPTILGHQSTLSQDSLISFEDLYPLERDFNIVSGTEPGLIVQGEIPEPGLADEKLDFSTEGPYSCYNWELFFHIPLHTAQLLTQSGKYEEAQIWLHRVFDPINKSKVPNRNARYWRIAPFYLEALKAPSSIEELLVELEGDNELKEGIKAWRADPFNPHLVARMRISAYMRKTVLQYLDNLIQWGDYLFRRHTIESINEASNIYIMAYEILGPKPVIVAKKEPDKTTSFSELEDLDDFSNVILEDLISYMESNHGHTGSGGLDNAAIINPLFFCIPGNNELLKYWDIVADRLFKVRHCQDISGRSRSLSLFEPPIDPALLVRARAAGLDINSVLDGLYGANKPTHRYPVLWQKALELCNEVRSLGGALLSALEKKDAEELTNIRASHEVNLLELQSSISDQRIEEANSQLESLRKSRENAVKRQTTYGSRQYMNSEERQAERKLNESDFLEQASATYSNAATVAALIPQFHAQAMASGTSTGGEQISGVYRAFAEFMMTRARNLSRQASRHLTTSSYKRRQEDWDLQKDLAGIDIEQIDKQIIAAEIRVAILEKETQNLQVQTNQSKQVGEFLRSKFTNQSLYTWMSNQLMNLYRQTYDLAVSLAMQAQASANHELGSIDVRNEINSIIRDHWDSQHKGLLAGEKLALQLRRLDNEYLEKNKRKYELTKSVSLSRLNPTALFTFIGTGECSFTIPKWLFDMDFPNHTNRRIKNVRLTIPAVTGPYTTLAAELSHAGETIATSNGQNDAGLFELNFRDERFLPFEGKSLDGNTEWSLNLCGDKQFDYHTISDVILNISYTAIDKPVLDGDDVDDDQRRREGLFSVMSIKNQFPREWSLLQESGNAVINIDNEHLSYGSDAISDIKVYPEHLLDSGLEIISSGSTGTVRFSGFDVGDLDDIHLFIES